MSKTKISELWNNFKLSNIYVIWVPKGKKIVTKTEEIFEDIIAKTFPDLRKGTKSEIWEAQWTLNKRNIKKTTPRHIITKLLKAMIKRKILIVVRKKGTLV